MSPRFSMAVFTEPVSPFRRGERRTEMKMSRDRKTLRRACKRQPQGQKVELEQVAAPQATDRRVQGAPCLLLYLHSSLWAITLTLSHLPLPECVLPATHSSTISNKPSVTACHSLLLQFFTMCPRPYLGTLLLFFYPHFPRCFFLVSVLPPHWPFFMSPH